MDSLGLHNNMALQSGMLPAETKSFHVYRNNQGNPINTLTYTASKYAVITITVVNDRNNGFTGYGNMQSIFVVLSSATVDFEVPVYYNAPGTPGYLAVLSGNIQITNTQLTGGSQSNYVYGIITLYR